MVMKKPLALLTLACSLVAAGQWADARSAVFGGGPFYSGGTTVMNNLKASGFHTVVLWSIHVRSNGDLWLNDQFVASGGSYVGSSAWPGQLATLKQAPTSVNRIEVSVGSFGVDDFQQIKNLIAAQGTGSGSILFRNFQALRSATGADAVDFDDESLYDVTTTVRFGVMLADLGYRVTLCPYTNATFWASVRSQIDSQRAGAVDRVYLQVYAGGASNNPASWNTAFGGFKVDPGLWCRHGASCTEGDTPGVVQSKMTSFKGTAGVVGGFMWLYDDMQKCSSQGTPAQYAAAINAALGVATPTPTPRPTATPAPRPTATPTPAGAFTEVTPSAAGVSASTSDGNVPGNTVDNNLATRWSANGDGQWIRYDLGLLRTVAFVKIAAYNGNSRQNRFDLQLSSDGSAWTTVINGGLTSGTTTAEETHDFADATARFVRYVGHGSTAGTFNSVSELSIFTPTTTGTPTPMATPTPMPTATATPSSGYVEVTPGAAAVTASTNDGNVPANTVDGSLTTRWSANGDGAWIQYDLGTARTVGRVSVAVYNGNARRSRFDLQVSNGSGVWTTVWSGESSGTTTLEQPYDFPPVSARWVRYLGHGNSTNLWNSLLEVSVFAAP
jgi:hypothetical protein